MGWNIVRPTSNGATAVASLYRGQPQLFVAGLVLLAMMVPTAYLFAVDPRLLAGTSVWTKPLKFQFSTAVHLFTLAALMLLLPSEIRASRLVCFLLGLMLISAAFEITYITIQAARGEASHFNSVTPFVRFMYGLMGVAAVAMMAVSAMVGSLILRHGRLDDPVVLGGGLGLIIGSALGTLTGIYMGGQASHWIGGALTDAGGLPIFGWSRTGGDLRVAHFVGLHMTQALPLAAWFGREMLPRKLVKPTIFATAMSGVLLTAWTLAQAVNGIPLIPAD